MRVAALTVIALLVLGSVGAASAMPLSPGTVRCVNPGGTGGCFSTIQAAINASASGDRIDVAAGTYQEHITLKDGVSIHGQGWASTIIDGHSTSAVSTVTVPWSISASTVLSGVQVTGGGTGTPSTSYSGGGIAVEGSPRIVNTWVTTNTGYYGGGVYIHYGSPVFENVPVWNNRALYGGGFYITASPVVTITGNPFEGVNGTVLQNSATNDGGGFYIADAGAVLVGLRIYANSAGNQGGGIHIGDTTQRVTLWLNDISGNTASHGGGLEATSATQLEIVNNVFGNPLLLWLLGPNAATYSAGGARFSASAGTVAGNLFFGNVAQGGDGGGAWVFGLSQNLRVTGNWFEGNTAYSFGGGLSLDSGAAPLIEANTFVTNTACSGVGIHAYQAGAARVVNNILARNATSCPMLAGGVVIEESPVQLINNTIALNSGDGVRFHKANGVAIVNNIIYSNTDDGIEHDTAGSATTGYTADYNDLFLNTNPRNGLPAGAHDVALDPQFVNAGPNVAARLHIQPGSPVATLGSFAWAPARDIDGEIRVFGGSVSIGADELPATGRTVFAPLAVRP
jgi:hypothetical protein